MSSTFNSYVKEEPTVIGGHTPVWCGTVAPIATGGVYYESRSGIEKIPAGYPCHYHSGDKYIDLCTPGNETQCNGYIYNDVYPVKDGECTVAVVMAHGEGLLIDRVDGADELNIAALQVACPTVILIRETQED